MFKKTVLYFFLLVFLFILPAILFAEETLTITTYYPSPYGSYKELTSHRMKIGTTYSGAGTSVSDDNLIVEGSVGIGVTVPTDTLHVAGDILATSGVHIGADAANNLIDDASGGSGSTTLYIGNASINVTASDKRMKENIEPSKINALGLIDRMQVVDFDWKEPNPWRQRGRFTGLIAQDVYEYLPQVVNKPANPDATWAVEYQHIVPYLIKAMQEQQKQIETLEAKIVVLETGGKIVIDK